jgi:hypothetical protein
MDLRLHITAARVGKYLGACAALLIALHLVGVFCHLVLHVKAEAFSELFDLDLEANMPTFFNCALFFVCATFMFFCGRSEEKVLRRGWFLLAAVFVFLGIDEGSQVHEKFMLVTLRLLNHGSQTGTNMGWFYYAWVIPYGLAAAMLVLVLGKWLFRLDPKLRTGLFCSGAVYVFGAVFMEMCSGKVAEQLDAALLTAEQMTYIPCEIYPPGSCHQYVSLGYIAAYTTEESCEFFGLVLCAVVLVKALERKASSVLISFGPKA